MNEEEIQERMHMVRLVQEKFRELFPEQGIVTILCKRRLIKDMQLTEGDVACLTNIPPEDLVPILTAMLDVLKNPSAEGMTTH